MSRGCSFINQDQQAWKAPETPICRNYKKESETETKACVRTPGWVQWLTPVTLEAGRLKNEVKSQMWGSEWSYRTKAVPCLWLPDCVQFMSKWRRILAEKTAFGFRVRIHHQVVCGVFMCTQSAFLGKGRTEKEHREHVVPKAKLNSKSLILFNRFFTKIKYVRPLIFPIFNPPA